MIIKTESTIFNVNADCIVNTINCVGFMGKGLALEFSLRYPELEKKYIDECKKKLIHTGKVYFYEINGQKIINFPTKFHFKYPSEMKWIKEGLEYFISNYKKWDIKSIAFPLLGASNGGLDAKEVEKVMEYYLSKIDIDVFICYSKLLEGKEKEMVEGIKKASVDLIAKNVKLNINQKMNLENNKGSINRFVDVSKIPEIGTKTYKDIFDLFYNGGPKKEEYEVKKLF